MPCWGKPPWRWSEGTVRAPMRRAMRAGCGHAARSPAVSVEPARPMNLLRRAAEDMFPGYFALVMATGALSIAIHLLGFPRVAQALLAFNIAAYAAMWSLILIRLTCFPGKKIGRAHV